jgi:hypothetical protein
VGYVEKDYGISWSDDIKDAEDEYEKFKGKLLGFDKFQVLASAGTDNADVEQVLLDSIKAYQGLLDNAENPAFQKSLDILKAIGLELDENGNIVGGFDNVMEDVTGIAKALGGVLTIVGILSKSWLALVVAIEYAYWTDEDFKKSVNESFGRIKENVTEVLPLFTSIFEKALPLVEEIALFVLDIVELVSPLIEDILEPLAPIIEPLRKIIGDVLHFVKNIVTVLAPIISMVAEALNILTPILEIVHGITWVVSTVLSGAVQAVLWVLTPVLAIFEAILKVVESIGEVVRALFQWDWGSLGKNLSNIWTDWKIPQLSTSLSQMQLMPSWKAEGGLATKGSLFYAGEAGPELVTQTSGGNSTIMNMRQLEDAVAKGMFRAMVGTQANESEQVINVGVDGQNLFTIFRGVARRNGYDLVKVN